MDNIKIPVSQQGLYPISDYLGYRYYKELQNTSWKMEDVRIRDDKLHLSILSEDQYMMLKKVIGILYFSDNVVIQAVTHNLLQNCISGYEQLYFAIQIYNEAIHAETYTEIAKEYYGNDWQSFVNMLDNTFISVKESMMRSLIEDREQRSNILDISDEESRYLDNIDMRIILSFVEGVNLMSTFGVILWLSTIGLFPVLVQTNAIIQNDETLHRNYHIERVLQMINSQTSSGLLIKLRKHGYSTIIDYLRERIKNIFQTVLNMELLQIDYLYNDRLDIQDSNLPSKDDLINYVNHLAEYILDKYLETGIRHKIPTWLESLKLERKNNFFEIRGSVYNEKNIGDLEYRISEF